MSIERGVLFWWFCDVCEDHGESESEHGAKQQANRHECIKDDDE